MFRRSNGGDATGRGRWRRVAGASHHGLVTVVGSGGSRKGRCSWLAGRGRGVGEELAGTAAASGRVRRKKMTVGQC
jgi:hypothetical protein